MADEPIRSVAARFGVGVSCGAALDGALSQNRERGAGQGRWRREGDSNPRYPFGYTD